MNITRRLIGKENRIIKDTEMNYTFVHVHSMPVYTAYDRKLRRFFQKVLL